MYIARGDVLALVAFLVVTYNCVISIESLAALYAKVEETQAEQLSLKSENEAKKYMYNNIYPP